MSPTYLSLVENERRDASFQVVKRIAAELKVPPEILYLEARRQAGDVTPEQAAILAQARELLLLATRIERDPQSQHDVSTSRPLPENSNSTAASTKPRRTALRPGRSRLLRRSALQPDLGEGKKGRFRARNRRP